MAEPLRIVSAACRYGPLILSMAPPARHYNIMHAIHFLGGEAMVRLGDQGFLLSDGSFAQRKPALIIATAAGQLVKNPEAHSSPTGPPNLYSEDMW